MTMADRFGMTDEPRAPKAPKQPKQKKEPGSKPSLSLKIPGRSKGPVAPEPVVDEYGNARSLDVANALRDVQYQPPSMFAQIITVYTTQMKRFCRDRVFGILILLILLVPIGMLVIDSQNMIQSDVSNTYMATVLMLAPVVCALVAALTCGSMVPQEFNERTAFMSMPLPMTRMSFIIGKFLAGFSLALAVVLAAYGFAVITSATVASVTYPSSIGPSIGVAAATMFCYCAIAFLLSTFMKRSGTMLSLLMLVAVLPGAFFGLGYMVNVDALGYAPFFGFDLSIMLLGMPPFGSVASIAGFAGMFTPFGVGSSVGIMSAVAIVVGILCLVLAVLKINKRDM